MRDAISSAIKFSDGTVENPAKITVTLRGEAGGYIHLSIKDEGVGIAEDDLARLFRPFQQAEQHNSRKYGGTVRVWALALCATLPN